MAINFDAKLGEQVAQAMSGIVNGAMQNTVVSAFEIVKSLGEDNPIVEGQKAHLREYEAIFNDQLVKNTNDFLAGCAGFSELANIVNSVATAKLAPVDDMGSISENNYDAAKHL